MIPPPPRPPENRGLPARWVRKHGAYYYIPRAGERVRFDGKRWFRLGATLADAYRTWADRIERPVEVTTVAALFDRYALEVVPGKRPRTQDGNLRALARLRPVFGAMPLGAVRPAHVARYRDLRAKSAPTAAARELEVLSHAFSMAVEWGALDRHPFKGAVRKPRLRPRTRYVEDWELLAALSVASPMLGAYMRLKLLTGLRRGDLLRIRLADIRADGLHVTTSKTGRAVIYAWTDELREAVELARQARRRVHGMTLFATRDGQPYVRDDGTASAWASLWQRYMARVLRETDVVERFTEHDLRAKAASDADSLEHARALLSHATSATTSRVYRRRPERVRPLR